MWMPLDEPERRPGRAGEAPQLPPHNMSHPEARQLYPPYRPQLFPNLGQVQLPPLNTWVAPHESPQLPPLDWKRDEALQWQEINPPQQKDIHPALRPYNHNYYYQQQHSSFPSINPRRSLMAPAKRQFVPQPSASPEDPLNWSWWKKHAVLLALLPGCLLSDWTLTWGTTLFELQAPEWYVHCPLLENSKTDNDGNI